MKKLNILTLIVGALIVALPFQGCETIELDLRENPNAVTPEQASPDLFLNAIQEDFAFFVESVGETTSEVVRLDYMFGRDYQQAYQPNSFDGEWSNAYAAMFEDIKTMNAIAEEDGFTYHIGVGQFIKAYTITALVDIFGDVPFSEANLGAENFNPNVDPGDQIYAAALDLLDEAIANFNAGGPDPQNDFYYDGDEDAWIRACNTLKLKLYATTRLFDPTAAAKFNAIILGGNYITSIDEDMEFQWGDSQVQPDTRHPRYSGDYTATGAGEYQSIHQMNYMLVNNDPRIRYYFYRQNELTPGEGAPPDLETLDCSLEFPPDHYFGFPFCNLPNGYWGRDHGNNDGIPPDTFSRTIHGVYPAGGKFDDNTFEGQGLAAGGGGAGITPILLASSVDFMRAEIALSNGNTALAKGFVLAGLGKSVEKVTAFAASVDPTADLSFEPTDGAITGHATAIGDNFDADPEGGWNVLGQEYFTALFGNGLEAYNFYRRTGFPTNLQPNLEANPGAFIRSFLYPANFVNNNSVVTQKSTVTEQVFWDTNPPSPAFPEAN